MASPDHETNALVKHQADCVSQTQFDLGMFQDSLLVVLAVVFWMESMAKETFVILLAISIVTEFSMIFIAAGAGELVNCNAASKETAQSAQGKDYQAVTDAAQQVTAAYMPAPSASDSASAASPGWASGDGPQRTALDMPTSAGQRFRVEGPQPTVMADLWPSLTSVSTLPSTGRVMVPSGQLADRSGSSAPLGGPTHRQGEAVEAVQMADDSEAGASPAALGGERAPVEFGELARERPGAAAGRPIVEPDLGWA